MSTEDLIYFGFFFWSINIFVEDYEQRTKDQTSKYYLCWFENLDTSCINTHLTVDKCLAMANSGDLYSQMNMMRINWIVQDLQVNPMYKPIVVDHDWYTIVGDTRLMACDILGVRNVKALAQLKIPRGKILSNVYEVMDVMNLDHGRNVIWHPEGSDPSQTPMTWFDVIDSRSDQHFVNEESAEKMIRRYLARHQLGQDFIFTRDWCKQEIAWFNAESNRGAVTANIND